MPDREKVIRAVETCFDSWIDKHRDMGLDVHGVERLKREALELLKEQEPKVLTREELKQFDERPCWFESHGTYMGQKGFWIIPYMFTCYETMYYVYPLLQINDRGGCRHYSELGLGAYNKTWRCWSARPTDKQREEEPWDEITG